MILLLKNFVQKSCKWKIVWSSHSKENLDVFGVGQLKIWIFVCVRTLYKFTRLICVFVLDCDCARAHCVHASAVSMKSDSFDSTTVWTTAAYGWMCVCCRRYVLVIASLRFVVLLLLLVVVCGCCCYCCCSCCGCWSINKLLFFRSGFWGYIFHFISLSSISIEFYLLSIFDVSGVIFLSAT